jgi:hypothetical protein
LIDVTLRPLGAQGLEKYLPAGRLKRVEAKVRGNAGKALAIASLVPPPFPFTAFVMAAAALQYPRKRLPEMVEKPHRARISHRVNNSLHRWQRFIGLWMDSPQPLVPGAVERTLGYHRATRNSIGMKGASLPRYKEHFNARRQDQED